MTTENGNGSGKDVWKWIAVTAVSILLGMMIQDARQPKDFVTKDEFREQLIELHEQNEGLRNEVVALRSTVNQTNVDVAGIAAKVGVTAHPVIAPSR